MGHYINTKNLAFFLLLIVQSPLVFASQIESDVATIESEEALARSESARQEAAEAQRSLEEEKLNSVSMINEAKTAISQAQREEKNALQKKMETEKFVAKMKKKKAELQSKQKQAQTKAKSAQIALSKVEKQKNNLLIANDKLKAANASLDEQLREAIKKERVLKAEIRVLKIKQKNQVTTRKAIQAKLTKAKSRLNTLHQSKVSLHK
ncbi:MAG: hypothetical protein RJB66_1248 [Pseudomonadota bacterium]|jgi:chromosome segregation ATPase